MGTYQKAEYYDEAYKKGTYDVDPEHISLHHYHLNWSAAIKVIHLVLNEGWRGYKPKKIENIVDLGCGPGHFAQMLNLDGINYHGYDFSNVAIEKATERLVYRKNGKNNNFYTKDECKNWFRFAVTFRKALNWLVEKYPAKKNVDDANANAGGPPSDIDDKNENDKDGKSSDSSKKRKFSSDEYGPGASAMDLGEDGALKKQLSENNFQQVSILGDGNCQFRAIAHQLDQLYPDPRSNPHNHVDVRRAIVNHISANGAMYDNPMYLDNETLTQYMARMSQVAQDATRRAQFGDNLTLQAAADLYNTNIELFNSANGEILQTIQPSNGGDNNNNGIANKRPASMCSKRAQKNNAPK